MARTAARLNLNTLFLLLTLAVAGCAEGEKTPVSPGSPAPTTLSGVVFERSGGERPLGGVTVNLQQQTNEGVPQGEKQTATTNPDGFYAFGSLSPGTTYIVTVQRETYITFSKTVRVEGNTRLDIEMVRVGRDLATLWGVVTEMTAQGPIPVAGVRVEDSNIHDSVTTDGQGVYRLEKIENGAAYLYATKHGYRTLSTYPNPIPVNGETQYDFQMFRE